MAPNAGCCRVATRGRPVVYLALPEDPGGCVEAHNRKKGCNLQPADEQLLICDQVSRQRATCAEAEKRQKQLNSGYLILVWLF